MVLAGFAGNARSIETESPHATQFGTPLMPETRLLEILACNRSLIGVLTALCRSIESALGAQTRCAVCLIDWNALKFGDVVAPSLPASFVEAMIGKPVVCEAGPCARAACLKSQVITADVENDPLWQSSAFRALTLAHGQRACWSTPIVSATGEVQGTFAVLQDRPGIPGLFQQSLIAKAVHLAGIAVERAQQEALLSRTAAFLGHVEHLSAMGSFTWHLATDELSCTPEVYRIFGFDGRAPVTSARILSRVVPEDLSALRGAFETARREGGDMVHEFRLPMPDRGVRYVRMGARAALDPQDKWDYIGAVQDVTEQRVCQMALSEARAELAYVARVVSLGELSASIAHEVKQPLSGIITNASTCLRMLAADPPDLAGARETAKRTLRDGNRASDVITRLRALFTRKTASGEAVELNQTAQEAITLALSDLQRRRVQVRTELMEKPATVRGDRIQLHQVILNLILNAADAMGGVDDRPRRLTIRTQLAEGDRILLSVQDTGTGIAAHEARLFEPFYSTKSDGMGIGLAISRAIVSRHGGCLWATSNEGPGATFFFTIPCAQSPQTPAISVAPSCGDRSASGWRVQTEDPCTVSLHL